MTTWTLADLPDLSGRMAVVTGASGGIGLITARELAAAGAHVVLAVRNVEKGKDVADIIPGSTEVRHLDMANLASVRKFAEDWDSPLHMLINNAGIMKVPLARTADGFESQLATNYLGPFVLTNLLLSHITDRVVTVSSQAHRVGHPHLLDLNFKTRDYGALTAYAESKLYVSMFALELQRRLEADGSQVRSVIAHPGVATTNLLAHRRFMGAMMRSRTMQLFVNDPQQGALPTLMAATADVPGGSYVGPVGMAGAKGEPRIGKASRTARNAATASKLWDITVSMTGLDIQRP
jgi:NAD(P)-dependent dehydrogenase (short-subunit alcohol dehydrogenase family)